MRRLASFCYHRRRLVVAAWIVLLFGLSFAGNAVGGDFRAAFKLPGSESQRAIDLMQSSGFSRRAGIPAQIVYRADQGVRDQAVRKTMTDFFAAIRQRVSNVDVRSPYDAGGERQISKDGKIAWGEVDLADRENSKYTDAGKQIKDLHKQVHLPGLRVELGGQIFANQTFGASEGIGLLLAIVILLVAFGSVLAMGLPILTALFGIGCGVALVNLATHVIAIPDFTTQAATMIGIGVGIDYALFIVTRYRSALRDGLTPEQSVLLAMDTSGRAVLFAGITVIISVAGMFLMGLAVMRGLAVGASMAVLLTLVASLTLVPAILGFAGRNIDKFGVPHRKSAGDRPPFWYRWSRVVQRRAWAAFVVGLLVLIALTLPLFSIRLGFSDAGNRPTSDPSRRAYDLVAQGFGVGINGPLVLAARTPNGARDLPALQRLTDRLNATPGVAFASPPQLNPAQTAAVSQLFPTTSPQDEATSKLVHHLRDAVVPAAVAGSGLRVEVGGFTGISVDFASYMGRRLPVFIGAVLILSFLLLMIVFRSLLVPLKAVIMNLLSLGAAYGVVVAVFQWGWGRSLIGVGKEGPVEAWVPMMLFAVVFGLSMDYEVFLLSRIKEEYDRTGQNDLAVADGLAATARVITAAGAIMVCVFASFILGDERAIKVMGLGLSVAVLIDATLVRLVLVPATMELLGDRNWWLPGWLSRLLPVVHVEARSLDDELDEITEKTGARASR